MSTFDAINNNIIQVRIMPEVKLSNKRELTEQEFDKDFNKLSEYYGFDTAQDIPANSRDSLANLSQAPISSLKPYLDTNKQFSAIAGFIPERTEKLNSAMNLAMTKLNNLKESHQKQDPDTSKNLIIFLDELEKLFDVYVAGNSFKRDESDNETKQKAYELETVLKLIKDEKKDILKIIKTNSSKFEVDQNTDILNKTFKVFGVDATEFLSGDYKLTSNLVHTLENIKNFKGTKSKNVNFNNFTTIQYLDNLKGNIYASDQNLATNLNELIILNQYLEPNNLGSKLVNQTLETLKQDLDNEYSQTLINNTQIELIYQNPNASINARSLEQIVLKALDTYDTEIKHDINANKLHANFSNGLLEAISKLETRDASQLGALNQTSALSRFLLNVAKVQDLSDARDKYDKSKFLVENLDKLVKIYNSLDKEDQKFIADTHLSNPSVLKQLLPALNHQSYMQILKLLKPTFAEPDKYNLNDKQSKAIKNYLFSNLRGLQQMSFGAQHKQLENSNFKDDELAKSFINTNELFNSLNRELPAMFNNESKGTYLNGSLRALNNKLKQNLELFTKTPDEISFIAKKLNDMEMKFAAKLAKDLQKYYQSNVDSSENDFNDNEAIQAFQSLSAELKPYLIYSSYFDRDIL